MRKTDKSALSCPRLAAQVEFLVAADELKSVDRKNLLFSGARRENAAEHSWHLTLLAMTFAEYAPTEVDIGHVTQLLIVHDLVEVHAGDHWELASDTKDVSRKEGQAAEKLFGLLPDEQYETLMALWQEFEARETAEAKFAKALDALHPMLLVWGPGGLGQTHVPLTAQQMKDLKKPYLAAYPALWRLAEQLLDHAVRRGTLSES